MSADSAGPPILSLHGIGKRYAVPVLSDVDLELHAGRIHALMGANGAGKSTLSHIVCGLTPPDAGAMRLDGEPYTPGSRRDAARAGVQLVTQELNLIPTLSVAENLFLTDLPARAGFVRRRQLLADAAAALHAVGLDGVDPRAPAGDLGVGHQQLVAVAAALAHRCRLLVLDEPTAALTDAEIARVFDGLRRLRERGAAILYISHRLDEIRRIADVLTVLRDGRVVLTRPTAGAAMEDLVRVMVGDRAAEALARPERHPGEVALRVERLTSGTRVRGVSFEVRRGEILGLAGLVGSGRTATLRAIFGADRADGGQVRVGSGPPLAIREPADAVRAGIGMLPEDRAAHGVLHALPVRANMTLGVLQGFTRGRLWIDRRREARAAEDLRARLDVRTRSIESPAGELSGGNQQKVVIARLLLRDPDVLLFDEPTRGIDVAAKESVYRTLRDLAARGKALVVASSELEELTSLCDRIAVMSGGRLAATFARGDWTEEAIVQAAFSAYGAPPRPER